MKNKVFLSGASTFPFYTTAQTIILAKETGFDGFELFNWMLFRDRRLEKARELTKELVLKLHHHEIWSISRGETQWFQKLFNLAGFLPKDGMTVSEMFGNVDEPCVLYPDRWGEASFYEDKYWLQTALVGKIGGKPGELALSFADFVKTVKEKELSVVFDLTHCLEFQGNKMGVENLPTDSTILMDRIEKCWEIFAPHTKEIHLNDCNPSLGHWNGRNLFLREGILPLKFFAYLVRKSGWTGVIVPEVKGLVNPFSRKKTREKVQRLNNIVHELFD